MHLKSSEHAAKNIGSDPSRAGRTASVQSSIGWARGMNAPESQTIADKLIRLPRVLELTGRGRTATLDDVRAGLFPRPIKVGAAALWIEAEVKAWIGERVRQARGHA